MLNYLRCKYHEHNLKRFFLARVLAFIINYSIWKISDTYHISRIHIYHLFVYLRILRFNLTLSFFNFQVSIYKTLSSLKNLLYRILLNFFNIKNSTIKSIDEMFSLKIIRDRHVYTNRSIKYKYFLGNRNSSLIEVNMMRKDELYKNVKNIKNIKKYNSEDYIEIDGCKVLNSKTPDYMSRNIKIKNNKIVISEFNNVTIIGQSDIIGLDNKFYHLVYSDFAHIKMSEELHRQVYYIKLFFGLGYRLIFSTKKKWYLKNFDSGNFYCLIGSTTSNYAHWITEHLPKLLYIDDDNFTLIIDSKIHANLKGSIKYVLKNKNFKIIELEPFKKFFFKEIKIIDLNTHVPFQFRNAKESPIRENDTVFNKHSLIKLRKSCVQNSANKKNLKIFIFREAEYRDFTNQKETANYFERNGFKLIDPSIYSFSDQVEIFSAATHIVGQSGAGFANMVFAKKNCKILMFATNLLYGNYRYYSNIASILDQKLYYFKCNNLENSANIHSNIYVDINTLKEKINMIEFFK